MVIVLSNCSLFAQSTNIPLQTAGYHFLDRLAIKSAAVHPDLHSSQKPYLRRTAMQFARRLDTLNIFLSRKDRPNNYYLFKDNRKWTDSLGYIYSKKPIFKHFYKYKNDFWTIETKDLALHINPVIHFEYLNDLGKEGNRYINTRGISLRGLIGQKVGFYVFLTENQAKYPKYVQDQIIEDLAVPGFGRFQYFKSRDGVDFFDKEAYISLRPIEAINLQFGHGRHFLGDGLRSLMLSDFGNAYLFLRLQTQVWRFSYQNLFKELIVQYDSFNDSLRTKKYAATHHLSLNLTNWLNLGLFETVVFSRPNGFDWQYLNPLIFYRTVEHDLGSPDNILIGMDFKANFLRHFSLYGQLVLDEFSFFKLLDEPGWWANKYAYQLGLKYFDIANISNLDGQLEFNSVRPYTYTHSNILNNYTHYNQPLAHPLGANFREIVGVLQYRTMKQIQFKLTAAYMQQGIDQDSINWGGDIFQSNLTARVQENDNKTLQGVQKDIQYLNLLISYQWRHNIFFDLNTSLRREEIEGLESSNSQIVSLGMRMNINRKQWLY